jgi:protein-S-isoprenylcysteine O-methyltransferase Ste14
VIEAGPICALVAVSAYGASHSLFASRWFKGYVHRNTKAWSKRVYRVAYNIVSILTFLPVLAIVVLQPGRTLYRIPAPYHFLALGLQSLAVMILILGLTHTDPWRFLGLRQLLQPKEDESKELVIHGLYRWVRHPLYTAGLLFIWLTPMMTTSILAMNLGLSAYLYIGSIFEERRLLNEFGTAYERYRRCVPRLIPLPWRCAPSSQGSNALDEP